MTGNRSSGYRLSWRMARAFDRVRAALIGRIAIDVPDAAGTVVISGSARSGTTWLAAIANYANQRRLMFEPFHCFKVDILHHWSYLQYLRPEEKRPEYVGPATAILSGDVRNRWIDQYNTRLFARRRLVKDIRIPFLLRWIKTNLNLPIILILRHPCAVASSQIKLNWAPHLEVALAQPDLMADWLEPFRSLLENIGSRFEKHILAWCIENYVPLRQFRPGEIHLLFYEHLCLDPHREGDRLFAYLGEPHDARVLRRIERPSEKAEPFSAVLAGEDLVGSWCQRVSAEEIQQAAELLAHFGLDRLYGQEPLPRIGPDQILMDG